MTLQEIETALAQGNLWVEMANGNYWRLRRNGQTKLWKRDPARWELPIKTGLRVCARLSNESEIVKDNSAEGRLLVKRV